ncbi:MAG TPA: DUF692 family multinuclear iron-containing protein [Methylocystis sp.]
MNAAPWLGSGLGYRPQFRAELFENRARIDFLEIIADHYFDASPEKLAELDLLAAHFPLVPHGLDLSLGGAEGLDAGYVEKLATLIERINPPWFSEHLCFTRGGGVSIGHLAALPHTFAAIDAVARNVDMLRKRIKVPLLLENVTIVVAVPGAQMDEAQFLSRVLERTGCGWLCDVANLCANAVNHGVDIDTGFERWPWDRVVQVHYAGGRWRDGALVDSHDRATAREVWALFERIAARAPVKGAVLERDENLPPFEELLAEVDRARTIMQAHDAEAKGAIPLLPRYRDERPPEPEAARKSLGQTQTLLAGLFTNAPFRREFFAHPERAALDFGLTTIEASPLKAVDAKSVARFVDSLSQKRLADARKTLPMTARALGAEFEQLLLPELQAPASSGRHRDDAAKLVARIELGGDDARSVPPWIVDLARYEMAFVAAARPGAVLILHRFRWPPRLLAAAALSGADVGAPRCLLGLWLRLPGARRLFHRLFSAAILARE